MDDKELLNEKSETPSNEIIEIEENDEISNTLYDFDRSVLKEELSKNKKVKKDKKEKKPLSKKARIIIIVCCVLLVIAIGIICYFLFIKKDKPEDKPEEPLVLIEKDNYTYADGKLLFKDKDKNELGEYTCRNTNEEYCYVAYYSNEDEFDIDKRVYENGKEVLNRSDILKERYVFVYDNNTKENGTLILYDIKEQKELGKYELVKEYLDEDVIVKSEDGNYNVITLKDGEVTNAINKNYDYIGFIPETKYLVAASNNNYILLNFDGKEASKQVPGKIKNFDDDSISVASGNSVYVYDYNGAKKVDNKYDYIRFVDSYILALDGKKMDVYNKNGNPMTGEAIKINSTDYNTKLVFNDENRQTDKKVAFEALINNGNLKISFDEEVKQVNLYEGELNITLSKVNYFDGKLYFYSDDDKTKLVGTYTCNNKNVVGKDTTELTNCYVAHESAIVSKPDNSDDNYMPIYNKTFAFINDVDSNPSSKNIVVWNLKTNKKLVTYKAVDAGFSKSTQDITYVDTAGTLLVAQNTNGSYGVVNVETDAISGVIAFSYNDKTVTNSSIKLLGTDYLFKRSDGTYHLYDNKGKEITEKIETKYEPVNYNSKYLLVKNNDKYLIYSLGGSIVSNEFKYIAMENTYYVAIDSNNKLGVYLYDSKDNLITEDLTVGDINYEENIKYSLSGKIVTLKYTTGGEEKVIEVELG